MSKRYNYPQEPIPPFEDAFPAHANGGHLARDWSRYSVMTIKEIAALSFGISPFSINSFLVDNFQSGTLHIALWQSRVEELKRAVIAGKIKTTQKTKQLNEDTLIFTLDVERYFIEGMRKMDKEELVKKLLREDLWQINDAIQMLVNTNESNGSFDELKRLAIIGITADKLSPHPSSTIHYTEDLDGRNFLFEPTKFLNWAGTKNCQIPLKIYEQYYGQYHSALDYGLWLARSHWTVEEAAYLFFSINPDIHQGEERKKFLSNKVNIISQVYENMRRAEVDGVLSDFEVKYGRGQKKHFDRNDYPNIYSPLIYLKYWEQNLQKLFKTYKLPAPLLRELEKHSQNISIKQIQEGKSADDVVVAENAPYFSLERLSKRWARSVDEIYQFAITSDLKILVRIKQGWKIHTIISCETTERSLRKGTPKTEQNGYEQLRKEDIDKIWRSDKKQAEVLTLVPEERCLIPSKTVTENDLYVHIDEVMRFEQINGFKSLTNPPIGINQVLDKKIDTTQIRPKQSSEQVKQQESNALISSNQNLTRSAIKKNYQKKLSEHAWDHRFRKEKDNGLIKSKVKFDKPYLYDQSKLESWLIEKGIYMQQEIAKLHVTAQNQRSNTHIPM